MRKITEIIIHCSATPAGRHFTVQDLDRWHRARGFSSIGYHFVIYLDGSIHPGRPVEDIGAHCLGHNAHSIGVCYIGGLDADTLEPADTRTPEQRLSLRELVAQLQQQHPGATVHGHNEFAEKACPCFRVKTEL
jgi:N-acetylmuramoyl-L-alanine amidase